MTAVVGDIHTVRSEVKREDVFHCLFFVFCIHTVHGHMSCFGVDVKCVFAT